ncbi:MAG TPA: delta-60 repeat domain-containing protein, partial [Bacillota bacterium]|nr:delta-60 repeat domain-containing protein [Bacillota bacterium]
MPSSVGSLDTSFFTQTVITPSWNGIPTVRHIVVQPDGRVLIGGGFDQVQHNLRHGLARLQADGTLDRSFIPAVDCTEDLLLEPNGKIVLAGSCRGLTRLNPDGTLDASFDGQVQGGATAVARLPGGEFLASIPLEAESGTSTLSYTVALFDAQGVLSSRWSTQYRSTTPLSYILVAPGAGRAV